MKWPGSLVALLDYGVIDEVLRPLMSGKEAQLYLVRCGPEERVAKVYKEAEGRSFRQRSGYTEGRRTRNSRDQRAVDKRTRHGRAQDEAAWKMTEVDRIHRLRTAGVRVPEPHEFIDGVLVMELIKDAEGNPAPRLGDLTFGAAEAGAIYDALIRETVRMLAADVVHADLSEFNVLVGADGPVIIDFPQAVDPTSNRNARSLLLRDVQNLHRFLSRFDPVRKINRLGEEMWKLYEERKLKPDTVLRGTYRPASGKTDTGAVLALIEDAKREALDAKTSGWEKVDHESFSFQSSKARSEAEPARPALRRVVDFTKDRARPTKKKAPTAGQPKTAESRGPRKRSRRRGRKPEAAHPAERVERVGRKPARDGVARKPAGDGVARKPAGDGVARKPAGGGGKPSLGEPRAARAGRSRPGGAAKPRSEESAKAPSNEGGSSRRKRSRRRRRKPPSGEGS